jgi:hypothetical protein
MRRPSGLRIGNVLQVRIGRGQPAGGGHRLVIGGVHAAGGGIDLLRQSLGVGRAQLGQPAIFEDQPRQRIVDGQLFQHVLGGGRRAARGLALHRQLPALEQDLLQLLGRFEVERTAGLACARASISACAAGRSRRSARAASRDRSARRGAPCAAAPAPAAARSAGTRAPASAAARSRGHSTRCSRSVTSASSAEYSAALLDADLVEADLLGALAGDILEMNGAHAQQVRSPSNPCRAASRCC